ncbi:MAG: hypothetical protein JW719_01175 [Pirellulales bacterium]|nr:hypothetical protein [Pirellulales bacterium]
MEVRRLEYVLLACVLALGGCRAARNTAALEQELRLQEDRIYQLQDCLQETQAALEACSRENESLRRSSADDQRGAAGRHSAEQPEESSKLDIEMPSSGGSGSRIPEMFRPRSVPRDPAIESSAPIGTLNVTPGVERPAPPGPLPPGENAPSEGPGAGQTQDGPTIDDAGRSREAARIEVGELMIEPIVDDSAAYGEEGFSLVVVPRDKRGAPVVAAAPVSVVVVDPAVEGPAARVGRWDFAAWELATLVEPTPLGEGFRIRLRWPPPGPHHKELHLFVRYETADGRKLHAEASFDLGRLAVAEPRRSGPSTASWQRKPRTERKTQAGPARVADRSAPLAEAPAWQTTASVPGTNGAPPWRGVAAIANETGPGERGPRTPQRVAAEPRRPTWSPERTDAVIR